MKIQGVIFDLDGTLLDTLEDIADSANAALVEQGHPPHPVDAYRYFVGDGAPTLIHRMAGSQPNMVQARMGPAMGPAAAMAEKCCPIRNRGSIGT